MRNAAARIEAISDGDNHNHSNAIPVTETKTVADQQHHAEACLQFFVEHLQACGRDSKTIAAYEADIKIFRRALGKDLIDADRTDIYRAIEQWKRQGVSDSTMQRRGSVLRTFCDLLFATGLISTRPMANVRLPKAWVKVPRSAPYEDLERVIAAIGTVSPFDVRDRTLLILLRDSGPRATAITQAELSDVDWKLGQVLLRHDKFGKEHWLPLSKRAVTALRYYVENVRPYFLRGRELPEYPYLFPRPRDKGGPITRQRLQQITNCWTEKVLKKRYSPHRWRHACLTEGAEKGMDLFDLMTLACHSSPDTTRRYIDHSVAHLNETFQNTHPRGRKEQKR